MKKYFFLIWILGAVLASCSYSVRYNALPHLKTVRIQPFDNQTRETGLENDVFEQLVEAFIADNRLNVVYEKGDSYLEGAITSYEETKVSEEEVRVSISFAVSFWEAPEKQIWKKEKLTFYANYQKSDTDLASEQMTQRQEALDKIIEDLSEKIFSEVLEDW